MSRDKSIMSIVISNLIGLCIFIILLILANAFVQTDNLTILNILDFFNHNLVLIVVISLISMIAEIFYAFMIPLSLSAPIIAGLGGILSVVFIFKILGLIDILLQTSILESIMWIRWFIYPLVFLLVVVFGYISIFFHPLGRMREERRERIIERVIEVKPDKKSKKNTRSWHDVGDEFKNLMYDFFSTLRGELKKSKKKKR